MSDPVDAGITEVFPQERIPYTGDFKPDGSRQNYLLNHGWRYLEQNIPLDEAANREVAAWQAIDLPHTWNRRDATDNEPGYRRDVGWYRCEIFIAEYSSPLIYRLAFEGVNISCEIFVNGQKAGSHVGGYVGFTVDIT